MPLLLLLGVASSPVRAADGDSHPASTPSAPTVYLIDSANADRIGRAVDLAKLGSSYVFAIDRAAPAGTCNDVTVTIQHRLGGKTRRDGDLWSDVIRLGVGDGPTAGGYAAVLGRWVRAVVDVGERATCSDIDVLVRGDALD